MDFMWMQWLSAILGLALIVIAFMGLAGATLMWTLLVIGVVVAVLGLWGAWETGAERNSGRLAHTV